MTTNITPIVKWAGGKTQLLGEMTSLLPTEEFTAYCEPFLSGGAMCCFVFSLELPISTTSIRDE